MAKSVVQMVTTEVNSTKGNLCSAKGVREQTQGGAKMNEVIWREIDRNYRFVTKRKSFKTTEAMEKFIEKVSEKDNFYSLVATEKERKETT